MIEACTSGWLQSIVGTIIGAAAGGFASYMVSRHFYTQANKEMDATTRTLRTLIADNAAQSTRFGEMIIWKMHNPGTKTEANFDDDGKFLGLKAFMQTRKDDI